MTKKGTNYCEKHDSCYNKEEDIWLEPKCNDKNCPYCPTRPEKPSEVKHDH